MNNSTCGYCGSSLGSANGSGMAYCGFCQMQVKAMKEGQRVESLQQPPFVGHDQMKLSTPELMQLHTKTLLETLRFMREERRSVFNLMRIEKKVTEGHDSPMYSNEYEMITKKCFVVENILRERMGYIPRKITDQLLANYENRCLDPANDKPMIINRPGQEIVKKNDLSQGITR